VPHLLGLPGDSTLTLFSGLIPSSPPNAATPTDAHLFFVLARNRHIADRERLVIWFNGVSTARSVSRLICTGGPGCSSFDGFLMEIGPLRMVPGSTTGEMREVEGAWNEYASAWAPSGPSDRQTCSSSISRPGLATRTCRRTATCTSCPTCVALGHHRAEPADGRTRR